MTAAFVEVASLFKTYKVRRGLLSRSVPLHAVDNVTFSIDEGTTFGLVGESGSGKSTIAKIVMAAEPRTSGNVSVGGVDPSTRDRASLFKLARVLQPVLQDPYSSLSPRHRVGTIIAEPMRIHKTQASREAERKRVDELLDLVGLSPAMARRFPHELSGGQRQRVAIARALSLDPRCLVLDEPVSALDVSIQAQVLNLLMDLQQRLKLTYLLISHDLSVVSYMSTQIGVLYLGQIMEIAPKRLILPVPRHPYTQALVASAAPDEAVALRDARTVIRGEIPSPLNPPTGCVFHPRCPRAEARCSAEKPALREIAPGHRAACHFA